MINWDYLSINSSDKAVELIKNNLHQINWIKLHQNENPAVIKILENNPEMINWTILSYNKNAVELLKSNKDKINWYCIALNPLITEIIDYDDVKYLISGIIYKNPNIFVYDYKQMEINFLDINEDILKEVLKPSRIYRNLELFNYDIDDMFE